MKWSGRLLFCSSALLILAAPSALAQKGEPPQRWTTEEAIAAYREIFSDWQTAQDSGGRTAVEKRLQEWAERVVGERTDLGDHAYAMILPIECNSETRERAPEVLREYLFTHERFPADAALESGLLDRTLPQVLGPAIDSGNTTFCRRAISAAAPFYHPTYTVYARYLPLIAERDAESGKKLIVDVLTDALTHPKISDEEKWELLELLQAGGVFGTGPVAVGSEGSRAIPFVPFKGPKLGGGQIGVEDFKGKVLLVDFWASWCGPCMMEMPNIVKAYAEFHGQGFEVLGVSLDSTETESKMKTVIDRFAMPWPHYYDGRGWNAEPVKLNGVKGIPHAVLLDRQGAPRYANLHGDKLFKRIKELLGEKPGDAATPQEPSAAKGEEGARSKAGAPGEPDDPPSAGKKSPKRGGV